MKRLFYGVSDKIEAGYIGLLPGIPPVWVVHPDDLYEFIMRVGGMGWVATDLPIMPTLHGKAAERNRVPSSMVDPDGVYNNKGRLKLPNSS